MPQTNGADVAGTGVAEEIRPRVGVSSCLLGAAVRFNGGHSRGRFLTDALARYVEWVPVCPEVEMFPLSVPVTLLRHHAAAGGAGYLAAQAYLDPVPAGLGLRNYTGPPARTPARPPDGPSAAGAAPETPQGPERRAAA